MNDYENPINKIKEYLESKKGFGIEECLVITELLHEHYKEAVIDDTYATPNEEIDEFAEETTETTQETQQEEQTAQELPRVIELPQQPRPIIVERPKPVVRPAITPQQKQENIDKGDF